MKLDKTYNMSLFLMIVCIISCSPRLKSLPNIKAAIKDTYIMQPPIYAQKADTTILKVAQANTSSDKPFIKEIKQNATYSPNSDTLLKRNLELQRIAIRIIDHARDVRIQKDSAMALLKGIRDTVNATKAITRIAKENQQIVKTTYKVFDLVILACVIISAMGVVASWLKPYWKKIHTA